MAPPSIERVYGDEFFTAEQIERLRELMTRWRSARDSGTALSAEDQAELDALITAELLATIPRSAARIAAQLPDTSAGS